MPEPREPLNPIEEFEGWEPGSRPEISDRLKEIMTEEEFDARLEEIEAGIKTLIDGDYEIKIQHPVSVDEEWSRDGKRLLSRTRHDPKTGDIDIVETYSYANPKTGAITRTDVTYEKHEES